MTFFITKCIHDIVLDKMLDFYFSGVINLFSSEKSYVFTIKKTI